MLNSTIAIGSFNTWKNTVKAGTGLIDDHFTTRFAYQRITVMAILTGPHQS